MEEKIFLLQLASILQSFAICFLIFCVLYLRKMLCRFLEDEFSVSHKLDRYLSDPLNVVNAHPEPSVFDKFGIIPIEK